MRKSEHKRVTGTSVYVQDRLRHKNVFCTSLRWIKWAKKYMARSQRRKLKQEVTKNARDSF